MAPATPEIYTLSLHDALPISRDFGMDSHLWLIQAGNGRVFHAGPGFNMNWIDTNGDGQVTPDRKSTRLNSSHSQISYAVFCLKKKKKIINESSRTYPMHSSEP